MAKLSGKIALVTGAASGLGEATARLMAAEGATVLVADINREAGERVAAGIGGSAEFTLLDVTREDAWQACIAAIVERHGGLDILVNNAGVVVSATIEDTTVEQLDFVRAVNFDGPFLGCKHAIPAMAASGGGSIVNIASAASIVGTPAYAAYSSTKGAVRSLTQTVAVHCKQRGNKVRCNSIHPGAVDTPMVHKLAEGATPLALEMTAMGRTSDRIANPIDVAPAVVYLASDEAAYVTGQVLCLDAGYTIA